ncbi:MAG TPA: hypothetical protein VM712_00555, partial [Gaiellales bacterium]|nr:hypothetical protein [Gaiellales bacterium]
VRTRTPRPGLDAPERLLTAIGIATCTVVATAIPLDDYRYYDLLGDPFTAIGLATAALVGLAGAAGAVTVRWSRRPR